MNSIVLFSAINLLAGRNTASIIQQKQKEKYRGNGRLLVFILCRSASKITSNISDESCRQHAFRCDNVCSNIEIGNRRQAKSDKLVRWKTIAREAANDYFEKRASRTGISAMKHERSKEQRSMENNSQKVYYLSIKDSRDCSSGFTSN